MSNDAVLAALTSLNERLDRLEAKVDASQGSSALTESEQDTLRWALGGLGNFKTRAPVFVDAAASLTTTTMDGAAQEGIDPVETGLRTLDLAKRAARPATLDLAGRLLDDDTVAFAGEALSPEAVAALSKALSPDSLALLDKALANPELLAFGLEFGAAMHQELEGRDIGAIASKIGRLTAVLDSPQFDALLAAGVLEAPLDVAADATTALTETRSQGTVDKVGPFGAFFKLMDSDVQKAIGFTLALAKRFGSRLS